jgi:hypothetical protein
MLRLAGEGENDEVAPLQLMRTMPQPSNAIGQARRPVEKDWYSRCRIDEEADIGQAPNSDDRQVEVPALAGMAQEVAKTPRMRRPCLGLAAGWATAS